MLSISNLNISFSDESGNNKPIIDGISFDIKSNQIFSLIGESGSGKSVTALSICKLLAKNAHIDGSIKFEDKELTSLTDKQLQTIRGNQISYIFQDPLTNLNPLHKIGKQIEECLTIHGHSNTKQRVLELLDMVELPEFKNRLNAYPHELSGGQRQRVMIAMALACEPKLLIADEPTTALDVITAQSILKLLKKIQAKTKMAVLLITHDLNVVKQIADKVAVMKDGKILEQGTVNTVFKKPKHEYTKKLLNSYPKGNAIKVANNIIPSLVLKDLSVNYNKRTGIFGRLKLAKQAVKNVNLILPKGQALGVMGQSGSGKTSLAMAVLRLIKSQGNIGFNGIRLDKLKGKSLRNIRRDIQVVFQDPFASLNPSMNVQQIITEGLQTHLIQGDTEQLAIQALQDVGLDKSDLNKYPHEFSGGQRQRINIARAIIMRPKLLILDEPTSALDLTLQAQVIELLKTLQKKYNMSYLIISHDLRVIKAISHHIAVMKDGEIVEFNDTTKIFKKPRHQYTKALIKAAS